MGFIEEAIISGVISKIVNDGADITKKKIKEAVQNRDTKHQTFESQIYVVTIDALNEFTRGEYKREQDQIVDAAEKILIGFRESGCGDIEIIRSSLRSICSYIDSDRCKEFLGVLCHEISRENNNQLYREIRLVQEKEESRKTTRIEQKIDSIDYKIERGFNEVIAGMTDNNRENECFKTESSNKFGNDKKEDYIDIWNDRLFLHRGGKSKPLTLADAFIMPDYVIRKSIKRIGFTSEDTLGRIIEKFNEYDMTSIILITGVPGMGKSSITSWIANKYKNDDRIIILRFRDFIRKELEEGLLDTICKKLRCENEDLEDKILVLDGFDEMKALDNKG